MKRHLSPLLAAALAACSLALGARAESLSEYCAAKGMVPDGVEGSGEWGCKPRGDGGSAGYDDGGAARRAAQRAAQEAAAAQRQREENEKKRKRLEEKLEFDKKKAEALGDIKELGSDDLELKGLNDDGGAGHRGGGGKRSARSVLRDQVTPNLELKGLLDEPEPKAKACRVVDSCMKALKEQEEALEQARLDQKDLYWALGTADFKHGLSMLDDAMRAGRIEPGMPPLYVYRTSDGKQPSLYYSVDQYRVTFDSVMRHVHSERVAYSAGLKGPQARKAEDMVMDKAREEIKERGHKLVQDKTREAAELALARRLLKESTQDQKDAEKALRYDKYLRRTLRCSEGRDEDFDRCFKAAESILGTVAEIATNYIGMPAMKARLEAFSSAYSGYTQKSLRRAQAAALAASKCVEGCRR